MFDCINDICEYCIQSCVDNMRLNIHILKKTMNFFGDYQNILMYKESRECLREISEFNPKVFNMYVSQQLLASAIINKHEICLNCLSNYGILERYLRTSESEQVYLERMGRNGFMIEGFGSGYCFLIVEKMKIYSLTNLVFAMYDYNIFEIYMKENMRVFGNNVKNMILKTYVYGSPFLIYVENSLVMNHYLRLLNEAFDSFQIYSVKDMLFELVNAPLLFLSYEDKLVIYEGCKKVIFEEDCIFLKEQLMINSHMN